MFTDVPNASGPYVHVFHVAPILGVTRAQVDDLVESGQLEPRFVPMGTGYIRAVLLTSLEEFVDRLPGWTLQYRRPVAPDSPDLA